MKDIVARGWVKCKMTVGFPKNVGRLWSVERRLSAKVIIPRKRRVWRRFPQPRLDFSDRLGCTCNTSTPHTRAGNHRLPSHPLHSHGLAAPRHQSLPETISPILHSSQQWHSRTTSRTTSASTYKTSHEQRYITHPFLTPTNQSPLHQYYCDMVWSQTSRAEHRQPLIQRSS